MIKFIKWFFSPSVKPINESHIHFYDKLVELENRIEVDRKSTRLNSSHRT